MRRIRIDLMIDQDQYDFFARQNRQFNTSQFIRDAIREKMTRIISSSNLVEDDEVKTIGEMANEKKNQIDAQRNHEVSENIEKRHDFQSRLGTMNNLAGKLREIKDIGERKKEFEKMIDLHHLNKVEFFNLLGARGIKIDD